jgi:iron complex outermembrane receptor protein
MARPPTLRRSFRLLILFAVQALPLAGASAQEVYRQTVVVTAAVTPVELGTASRTLTVVTRDQIQALPAASVADVLRMAASVDVRARGERGVQSDFSIRGAGFGQVLVLVDGVRLNDVQSGHHNGDIPVPIDAVERIEVLHGPGASLFGADAFSGTINVITRRDAEPGATVLAGSNGLAGARGQWGLEKGSSRHALSGSSERSGGFMYDRDFVSTTARSQSTFGNRTRLAVSWLNKEFGANNFYGGNAPSREWTDQTLISLNQRIGAGGGWGFAAAGSYRSHGDRFVFNQTRPELSDNRHRTHTAIGTLTASRSLARQGSLTLGTEVGQDWIRSSNLGDHELSRLSGFAEWRQPFGQSVHVDASLRADHYDQFDASWNPSVGVGWWATGRVRLRASVARAFRVPTFTERYYSDPANLARPEVGPESAWAEEGGADIFLRGDWIVQAGVFRRTDTNVIDWLRPNTTVRWQTYNVRDVDTVGVELGASRPLPRDGFVRVEFTGLDVSAPEVTQLSKYALDYAPVSFTATAVLPRFGRVRLAPRFEYKDRRRPRAQADGTVAVSSQDYALLDVRAGVRLTTLLEVLVDGTNLFDVSYQEVAGVEMPGAKLAVMLVVGSR